jgi:hypothetical protein
MWGFQEGKIEFAPTYKINKIGTDYNSKRVPAWTDRVIFRSKNEILK